MTKRIILYFQLLVYGSVFSQKYNFVNWTVEDGLVQSQSSFICQDQYRQLWIGTEGGISRFDGKKFTAYTIQDGLPANHINTMLSDLKGNMWIGTDNGLCVYNGKTFKSFKAIANNILQIQQSKDGSIYALDNFNLVMLVGDTLKKIIVTNDSSEKISSLNKTTNGELILSVYKKGIYCKRSNNWFPVAVFKEQQKKYFIRKIFISSKNDTLLTSSKGLLQIRKGQLLPYVLNGKTPFTDMSILCVAEDSKQNLWLGTEKGVFKVEGDRIFHFDEKSGFSDNSVNHIYKDAENNLWFATNGDGIYKFKENTFTYYDKSSGLSNTIVMGVVQTPNGQIYTATYGGHLYKVNSKSDLEAVKHHGKDVLGESKINCLYADDEGEIWVGTTNKGVYTYHEKTGLKKIPAKPDSITGSAVTFFKDLNGNMLIGTNQGLFVRKKEGSLLLIKTPRALVTDMQAFDNNNSIVATSKGIYLLDKHYTLTPFYQEKLGRASVLCLAKNKENIWIGTTDKGVINFNYKTGKIINYTTVNGLPSDFIYSIDVSIKNKAWIGTGFGISNLQLNDSGKVVAIKNYGRSDGLLGMECNHNSLLKASDSSLWFGTTKGLFHFNPPASILEKNQPLILLRSVKLFSSVISDSLLYKRPGLWFNVPEGLTLASKQNHLTFELGSIYFTNPEDVLYKYKLDGIDKEYTITNNPNIIYPALPPGKYTLKVMGITKSGNLSSNQLNYSFEIKKAFYQTGFFQMFVILLLIGTGALMAYVFTRGKQKRKQKAKELLEQIREEEFVKLRQRTAEDFHDEMGNSLTRISVLTDVLKSKINNKEPEITKLVQQIKENTTSLYNGSRDIIWSLNSQNDGLFEIVEHIKDIGNELFQETNVDFNLRHNIAASPALKLKLDYSRNMIMIFKEAYNNILKHAKAAVVSVDIELNSEKELKIIIRDNGVGFNTELVKGGNGIKNMKNRVSRMNGGITLQSSPNGNTELIILLDNCFI